MSKQELVLVRFINMCRPYNPGEVAGFTPDKAKDLVSRDAAVYVNPPAGVDEKGQPLIRESKKVEIPEGLKHNGAGWYELVDFKDEEGEPVKIQGIENAKAELIRRQALNS
jgi:hypothetical protein